MPVMENPSVRGGNGTIPVGAQIVALIVFAAVLWAQVPDVLSGIHGRDALQLLIAKSLAEGEGLRLINTPGAPSVVAAPLYPFFLSFVWRVWPAFPENVTLMAIMDATLLAGASLGFAWYLPKRSMPAWLAYGVTLLAFLNVPMIWMAGARVPEPAFWTAAIWAVFIADFGKNTRLWAVVSGLLGAFAALSISIGWVVLGGVAVGWMRRGAKQLAIVAVMVGGVFAAVVWGVLIASSQTGASYVGVSGLVSNPVIGLAGVADIASSVFPWGGPAVVGVVAIALVVGAILGTWMMFAEAPALVVTSACLVAVASLRGSGTAAWVMAPGLVVLVCGAIHKCADRWPKSQKPVMVFSALLVAGFLWQAAAVTLSRSYAGPGLAAGEPFDWILPSVRQELPDSAVIATERPFMVYLHTNRRTVGPPGPDAGFSGSLCTQGVTHLVENRTGGGFAGREISGSQFTALFAMTDGPALYRLECKSQP